MSFWCFVCFSSLFNLQGTSRSPKSAELCYFITSVISCQALFSSFLNSRSQLASRELVYISTLSSSCQDLFRIFSESTGFIRFRLAVSQANSVILAHDSTFVNTFFQVFSTFFAHASTLLFSSVYVMLYILYNVYIHLRKD